MVPMSVPQAEPLPENIKHRFLHLFKTERFYERFTCHLTWNFVVTLAAVSISLAL